jgi:hypothetical protein
MGDLINFYKTIKSDKIHNPNEHVHGLKLPFRALICCSSGGGKTNLISNIIYAFDKTFHNIIVVSKAEEPLYDMMAERLKNVSIHYNGEVPDFPKMDKGENGLIIFDDMVLTKNNKIGEAFIRLRKMGYSCVYITQSFFGTPKIIRQNVGLVWLGKGISKRDLRLILSEFSLGGMNVDKLEEIYNSITKQNMNFMLIDTNTRTLKRNINDVIISY